MTEGGRQFQRETADGKKDLSVERQNGKAREDSFRKEWPDLEQAVKGRRCLKQGGPSPFRSLYPESQQLKPSATPS